MRSTEPVIIYVVYITTINVEAPTFKILKIVLGILGNKLDY